MSAKRLVLSLIYGILSGYGFLFLTASCFEGGYVSQQALAGNLGPVFYWLGVGILMGIAGFVLGLSGKLPGTK